MSSSSSDKKEAVFVCVLGVGSLVNLFGLYLSSNAEGGRRGALQAWL
jgi:hypothetical protein